VRAAVIGHVEWVEFLRVEAVPKQGDIAHVTESWSEAAGGGAVAAVQLQKLGAETLFFTALGDDDLGHRAHEELKAHGLTLHVSWVKSPQRRALTFIDDMGERTIVVIGDKLRPRGDDGDLPWEVLRTCDAVYFTGGDPAALRKGRFARTIVATARELATLQQSDVEVDALVSSSRDAGERYEVGDLDPAPKLVVATSGPLGGWMQPGGPYEALKPPGPVEDTYGAGDSFAAGLTFGLGRGDDARDAVALAARCGASVITGRGPYSKQLEAEDL
jgi:ribokinase